MMNDENSNNNIVSSPLVSPGNDTMQLALLSQALQTRLEQLQEASNKIIDGEFEQFELQQQRVKSIADQANQLLSCSHSAVVGKNSNERVPYFDDQGGVIGRSVKDMALSISQWHDKIDSLIQQKISIASQKQQLIVLLKMHDDLAEISSLLTDVKSLKNEDLWSLEQLEAFSKMLAQWHQSYSSNAQYQNWAFVRQSQPFIDQALQTVLVQLERSLQSALKLTVSSGDLNRILDCGMTLSRQFDSQQ
ncbi:hypothetical protein MIR68_010600 [Amoeboaphelidium protococcarum]|nr:hypothetical protein MIR68_010600 [Amoeboaphelidium protococcarum]